MTLGRCLLLLGFVCLTIMVLTHVAETLRLFSIMGWGLIKWAHFLEFWKTNLAPPPVGAFV
jgi:hypothetical protein